MSKKEKLKWKKWNAYDGDGDEVWECPECEFELLLSEGDPWDNEYYFCPKCGADLRVKKEKKSKLKPCPHCGGEAQVCQDGDYDYYIVICKKCWSQIHDVDKQSAIDLWNKRI